MRNRLDGQWISVLFILPLLVLAGCGTFETKIGATEKFEQHGHPYSGVHFDLIGMKCILLLPAEAKEKRNVPYWQSVPVVAIGFTVALIDIPISFAADTLLLPSDLLINNPPRKLRLKCDNSY